MLSETLWGVWGFFLSMSNPISLHGPAIKFSLLQKLMFWFVGLTVCQVHKFAFGNNHSNPHTTPRPLFLFPWFQMTNTFLLRYSDYVPFPLERSSSVRANVKLRGRVAQITANKWYSRPIIQASLFICDIISMHLFTNVIQSNGPGEQLKAKSYSHFSSISREAFPILLRIRFGGTKVLNALTSPRPSVCVSLQRMQLTRSGQSCPLHVIRVPLRSDQEAMPWGLGCSKPLARPQPQVPVVQVGKVSRCWLMCLFWRGHKKRSKGKLYLLFFGLTLSFWINSTRPALIFLSGCELSSQEHCELPAWNKRQVLSLGLQILFVDERTMRNLGVKCNQPIQCEKKWNLFALWTVNKPACYRCVPVPGDHSCWGLRLFFNSCGKMIRKKEGVFLAGELVSAVPVWAGKRQCVLQVGTASAGHTAQQAECRLISDPLRPLVWGSPAPDHLALLRWSLPCSGEGS